MSERLKEIEERTLDFSQLEEDFWWMWAEVRIARQRVADVEREMRERCIEVVLGHVLGVECDGPVLGPIAREIYALPLQEEKR